MRRTLFTKLILITAGIALSAFKLEAALETVVQEQDIQEAGINNESKASVESNGGKMISSIPFASSQVPSTYTYDPTGKRDPFRSLLLGDQSIIEMKKVRAEKFSQFMENLKSIQPVNLYLYDKIKRKDPVLYRKLKRYSHFFKNQRSIEKVSLEERDKKLLDYMQLLGIARKDFHDKILGPLQNEYSSLKLSGVIWEEEGAVALVQTFDGKGYTVRINDSLGPNYGIIKNIGKDKIVIVEKYISYTGDITKKIKEIKLPGKEESII